MFLTVSTILSGCGIAASSRCLGYGIGTSDATDPGDRAIQIIKRAFHDLCGYFGGKTAGAPSFVDHDRAVRFPHGGQDRGDVEWPEYPEINDLGRDALLGELDLPLRALSREILQT